MEIEIQRNCMRELSLFPSLVPALVLALACPAPSNADPVGEAHPASDGAPDAKATPEDRGPSHVRACFDRFASGLESFDKEAVLGELTGEKDEMMSAASFLDYLVAGDAFEQAFRATHGDDGWAEFNDPEGAALELAMPIDRRALATAQVRIDGDRARMTFEGGDTGPGFRKVDGEWKLVSTTVMPHDPGGKQRAAFARMADILVQAMPRAKDASLAPDDLDRELGEALEAAFSGRDG